MKIFYKSYLKEIARKLRNNSTFSEILLWNELKCGKINGYDFHRQKPIEDYIVDFYCHKLRLVIEVDGESHALKEESDKLRQQNFEHLGLKFLRFDDMKIVHNMEEVLRTIKKWIEENS